MLEDFRFLVICRDVSCRPEDRFISLDGVVNEIVGSATGPTELKAVVGAILQEEMWGRRLDLMAHILGRNGAEKIPGYSGTPLILPEAIGPQVLPYDILLPTPHPGIYSFSLFDRDLVLDSSGQLLATYTFSVSLPGDRD